MSGELAYCGHSMTAVRECGQCLAEARAEVERQSKAMVILDEQVGKYQVEVERWKEHYQTAQEAWVAEIKLRQAAERQFVEARAALGRIASMGLDCPAGMDEGYFNKLSAQGAVGVAARCLAARAALGEGEKVG